MSTPSASESRNQLAERLKERVYVTFTALAVLMALSSHDDNPEPGSIALSLLLTTVGVLLAGFAADVIAHSAVHAALPTGPALRHMARVAAGAFGAIVVPLILMLLAGIEAIPVSGAVIASQIVLVVALGIFAFLALRRVNFTVWRKLILAAVLAAVGALVVVIQLAAHSL